MKSKKEKNTYGRWFIIIGILLIAAALLLTGKNLWDISNAEKVSQSLFDKLIPVVEDAGRTPAAGEIPDYVLNPDMEMPVEVIDGVEYIGTISIERLGVQLPVAAEESRANLKKSPCRYKGSAYKDNMIIAAHNYPSHFGNIKNLSLGDSVVFNDMDGNRFEYEVISSEMLKGTDVNQMEDGDWDLTIFTCTIGGKNRVTVRCERIK